jgi:excisionase family DNA binding protein
MVKEGESTAGNTDRQEGPGLPAPAENEGREAPAVFSVRELARRWKVNPKSIYREIRDGRLPVLRLGRVIRISLAVVVSLESQGRVLPSEES